MASDETAACDASAAEFVVGAVVSAELVGEAQAASGANAVRLIRPGQAVTLEFRPDRLNLEYDAANRVVAVTCG